MPTYEYRCKACGEHLEVVQSFKDAALTECPACGGVLRKVFGNIGITFKGSGFYRTDNRSGARREAAAAGTSDSSETSEKSSESKSESKPEKSSESKSDSKSESKSKSGSGSSSSSSSPESKASASAS